MHTQARTYTQTYKKTHPERERERERETREKRDIITQLLSTSMSFDVSQSGQFLLSDPHIQGK